MISYGCCLGCCVGCCLGCCLGCFLGSCLGCCLVSCLCHCLGFCLGCCLGCSLGYCLDCCIGRSHADAKQYYVNHPVAMDHWQKHKILTRSAKWVKDHKWVTTNGWQKKVVPRAVAAYSRQLKILGKLPRKKYFSHSKTWLADHKVLVYNAPMGNRS